MADQEHNACKVNRLQLLLPGRRGRKHIRHGRLHDLFQRGFRDELRGSANDNDADLQRDDRL